MTFKDQIAKALHLATVEDEASLDSLALTLIRAGYPKPLDIAAQAPMVVRENPAYSYTLNLKIEDGQGNPIHFPEETNVSVDGDGKILIFIPARRHDR